MIQIRFIFFKFILTLNSIPMKNLYIILILLFLVSFKQDRVNYADYTIKSVNLNYVHLTDNFWLPKIKTLQDVTLKYAFNKCEEEGRLDNFLIAGGKMEGSKRHKVFCYQPENHWPRPRWTGQPDHQGDF